MFTTITWLLNFLLFLLFCCTKSTLVNGINDKRAHFNNRMYIFFHLYVIWLSSRTYMPIFLLLLLFENYVYKYGLVHPWVQNILPFVQFKLEEFLKININFMITVACTFVQSLRLFKFKLYIKNIELRNLISNILCKKKPFLSFRFSMSAHLLLLQKKKIKNAFQILLYFKWNTKTTHHIKILDSEQSK